MEEAHWDREWLLGWCDVTAATNERTSIVAFIPRAGVGHTFPLLMSLRSAAEVAVLAAALCSLVVDYVCRQKIGGTHLAVLILKQLPVLPLDVAAMHASFIVPRVAELACTSTDMADLATDLDYDGPMVWDDGRRAVIRAEIDAYMFVLYGIPRYDVDHIMESFQTDTGGLKNNEIAKFGTYRSKVLVLDKFDKLKAAGLTVDNPVRDVSF